MTYPENIEQKIGFDAVRERIRQFCSSPLGGEYADKMDFRKDYATVCRRLDQTNEMLGILTADAGLEIGAIHDRRKALISIRVPGTALAEADLPGLRACLETMASIASFFAKHRDETTNDTPYPALDALAANLMPFPAVAGAIDRIIDRHGQIKDNASPELADIRRSMTAASASISSAMRRVISAAVREGYLDADATPSMRDGRLVIPVAPMYKRKIPGIVHDESASGKTYFIEPAEVVEANNRLRELSIEEHREIMRILRALADEIRPNIDELLAGFALLGEFDFIAAKARYARDIDASMPSLNDRPELEWYGACHPVLKLSLREQGRPIVPLDITLSPKTGRILVISGPNAGGKSVTLKTTAIVQYMTQCGVLPPVYSNSHIGMFNDIFIDIGDDQSIEDDLSTYSSHLRNMKQFLMRGNRRSLILIDEFGSGTEPEIGGAIAQAVLKQLNADGVWGVITTHYHNLKQFAEETPGLINGSMLYDRHLMQPLFKLAIGHPGSSFAIEIARKTGLPEAIVKDAQEIVGSDYVNMDKYLLDIARDRRYWEKKRDEIHRKEKQLDETLARYSDDVEKLSRQRKEIISEARQEAKRILDSSNASIEKTIRDIRSAQADKEKTKIAREKLKQTREALENDIESAHPLLKTPKIKKKKEQKPATAPAEKPLQPGDNVCLKDGGQTVGTVEQINGKEATVIFGSMRTTVKLDRLKRTIRQPQSGGSGVSYIAAQTSDSSRQRQLDFSAEIDVRGMRADEAVQAVMYYIDDAVQFNAGRVRILHGTGTGALRQSIRQYLDTVGAVRYYHDEDIRFGGPGITVVEFN